MGELRVLAELLPDVLDEFIRQPADKASLDAMSNEDALGLYLSLQAEEKRLLAKRRRLEDCSEDDAPEIKRITKRRREIRDLRGAIVLSHPDE